MTTDTQTLLARAELFYGQTTAAASHLYARLADLPGGGDWTLTGKVRGPECELAESLSATFALQDLGAGPTLLGRALITEPTCWTPDVPAQYVVQLELRRGGTLQGTVERSIGIRPLGARGNSLFLEQRRWVLRGVFADEAPPAEPDDWRAAPAVMVVEGPSESLCEQASRRGAMIVARLSDEAGSSVAERLRRLAQHAAVIGAIIRHDADSPGDLRAAAPNLLLAAEVAAPARWPAGAALPDWAQLAAVHVTQPADLLAWKEPGLPLVAIRPRGWCDSLAEARRGCDELQRDLATVVDCAGYIV